MFEALLPLLAAFTAGAVTALAAVGYGVWQLWSLAKARTPPKTIVHPLMEDAEDAEAKATTDLLIENAVVLEGPVRTTSEYRTESDLLESLKRRFLSGEVHKESKAARLRHNTLHLLVSETDREEVAAVVLDGVTVDTFPTDLTPNEVYSPAFPLRISHPTRPLFNGSRAIYMFVPIGIDKETWLIALRKAAHWSDEAYRKRLRQEVRKYRAFATGLHTYMTSGEINPQLRWINALMARMFWSANSTHGANEFFRAKLDQSLQRTLARKGRPSYLDYLTVKSLNAGDRLPFFAEGGAVDIAADGTVTLDAEVRYHGVLRVEVEAMASVDLPYHRRIAVPLLLAVDLRKLSGRLRVVIKPPPTDRVWVGFHERPALVMDVQPVVAETSVKFDFVRTYLERLLLEMLATVMVLPNMDDYPLVVMAPDGSGAVPASEAAAAAAASVVAEEFRSTSAPAMVPAPAAGDTASATSAATSPTVPTAADAAARPASPHKPPVPTSPLGGRAPADGRTSESDTEHASSPSPGARDEHLPPAPTLQATGVAGRSRSSSLSERRSERPPSPADAGSGAPAGRLRTSTLSASTLLDKTATNAAELRRRAANASSSLLSKANAKLAKVSASGSTSRIGLASLRRSDGSSSTVSHSPGTAAAGVAGTPVSPSSASLIAGAASDASALTLEAPSTSLDVLSAAVPSPRSEASDHEDGGGAHDAGGAHGVDAAAGIEGARPRSPSASAGRPREPSESQPPATSSDQPPASWPESPSSEPTPLPLLMH